MTQNKDASSFIHSSSTCLETLRKKSPIIHNMTNEVAAQRTADILLALGLSPLMTNEPSEIHEITQISNALSINIGTLTQEQLRAIFLAVKNIQRQQKPWVLDPVGAGASQFRLKASEDLIANKPDIIRGNASEILALAGEHSTKSAIDSKNSVGEAHHAARLLADKNKNIVVVSGPIDYITDGLHFAENQNGHPLMASLTATGCALSAVMAGFLTEKEPFEAAKSALLIYNIAGETAARKSSGPGSFQLSFLDALFNLTHHELCKHYRPVK
ncbi:hydroxyethylthiazole kinase [Acetobacteraceae bacterium]|nr:hydroxyethylthiazole kinase [Acetobacteraceae bacterium]